LARLVLKLGTEVHACVEMMSGAIWVRDLLVAAGWRVQIAHARKARDIAPVACKTDRVDARVLAELCRRDLVPELWIASLDDRALRERLRRRMHLVRLCTSARNRIFGLLTQWGLRCSVERLREPDGLELRTRVRSSTRKPPSSVPATATGLTRAWVAGIPSPPPPGTSTPRPATVVIRPSGHTRRTRSWNSSANRNPPSENAAIAVGSTNASTAGPPSPLSGSRELADRPAPAATRMMPSGPIRHTWASSITSRSPGVPPEPDVQPRGRSWSRSE